MVMSKFVSWMRTEAEQHQGQGRVARWLGRNWAHLTYATHIEPTWLEVNHPEIPVTDCPRRLPACASPKCPTSTAAVT